MQTRSVNSLEGPPIIVLPPFDTTEELAKVFYKLAWYAGPYMEHGIRFLALTSGSALDLAALSGSNSLDTIFDSHVPAWLEAVAERTFLLPATDAPWLAAHTEKPSCIVWNARKFHSFLKEGKGLRDLLRHRPAVLIDKSVNPFESFHLPQFFNKHFDQVGNATDHERFLRFLRMVRQRPDSHRCNVYGGGYSLLDLPIHNTPAGLSILCNAVITQHDLVRRLAPVAVTITDPLLAGCSRYGELFRRELIQFTAMTEAWIFTLDLYAPYYRAILPEHARERVIGVPVQHCDFPPAMVNLDFEADFFCVDSWNVVTTLSIPLATTISDRIGLLGLDGIDPAQPDVYNSISIHDRHDSIASLHGRLPGNIDAAYNIRHAQALELVIRTGEKLGKRFDALTRSHYPILQELRTQVAG